MKQSLCMPAPDTIIHWAKSGAQNERDTWAGAHTALKAGTASWAYCKCDIWIYEDSGTRWVLRMGDKARGMAWALDAKQRGYRQSDQGYPI